MSRMRFSVEPTHVHVLTRDGFYITVEGAGIGFLRCQGIRRWVCGTFREKFLLSNPPKTHTQIVVEGRGFGGSCQVAVSVVARAILRAPAVFGNAKFLKPVALPVSRKPLVRTPSIHALGTRLTLRWNEFLGEQALRREDG
jgi:hypothetical protein